MDISPHPLELLHYIKVNVRLKGSSDLPDDANFKGPRGKEAVGPFLDRPNLRIYLLYPSIDLKARDMTELPNRLQQVFLGSSVHREPVAQLPQRQFLYLIIMLEPAQPTRIVEKKVGCPLLQCPDILPERVLKRVAEKVRAVSHPGLYHLPGYPGRHDDIDTEALQESLDNRGVESESGYPELHTSILQHPSIVCFAGLF